MPDLNVRLYQTIVWIIFVDPRIEYHHFLNNKSTSCHFGVSIVFKDMQVLNKMLSYKRSGKYFFLTTLNKVIIYHNLFIFIEKIYLWSIYKYFSCQLASTVRSAVRLDVFSNIWTCNEPSLKHKKKFFLHCNDDKTVQ